MKTKFLLALFCLVCFQAVASVEEGVKAYKNKNFPLALSKLREHPTDQVAQFYLGEMYSIGKGVPKDAVQALAWYRKAADQDNANAQFNLGNRYNKGEVVPKNDVQAVAWYLKATDQQHVDAQLKLAQKYKNGEGMPKNKVVAYALFHHLRFKDADTVKARVLIEEEMSQEQIAAAQNFHKKFLTENRCPRRCPIT